MCPDPIQSDALTLAARVQELEARLEESEETLEAIRRGEIDALVMGRQPDDRQVYTLESADRPYRVLIEQMQEGAVTLGEDGTVLYCNRRLAALLNTPQERVIGQALLSFVAEEDQGAFGCLLAEAKGAVARSELIFRALGGRPVPVYLSLSRLQEVDVTLLCGVLTDLTAQKMHVGELATANARLLQEIAERERVEDALRQAQKMEAVGQLTGGLAHDFNNLLTGISGSLELLHSRLAQGRIAEAARYVTAAQGAASRAAALTHRLLAFSRRQTLDPVPTSPNRLVAGMEELIRRTVGPAVTVETVLAGGLWPTLCDPHQLENSLLNLAINARDAMPDGGRLTIETANTWLDEPAARERDMAPGQYVAICVSDTGTGMPLEVVARAFDPFFTTKPIGMGTGLGLSMIYGFAKQSGGQARIYSEVDQGTTVRLYLPRHDAEESNILGEQPTTPATRAQASETVLVVDDEATIRMLVADVLGELGYATIEAENGAAGLAVVQVKRQN